MSAEHVGGTTAPSRVIHKYCGTRWARESHSIDLAVGRSIFFFLCLLLNANASSFRAFYPFTINSINFSETRLWAVGINYAIVLRRIHAMTLFTSQIPSSKYLFSHSICMGMGMGMGMGIGMGLCASVIHCIYLFIYLSIFCVFD